MVLDMIYIKTALYCEYSKGKAKKYIKNLITQSPSPTKLNV